MHKRGVNQDAMAAIGHCVSQPSVGRVGKTNRALIHGSIRHMHLLPCASMAKYELVRGIMERVSFSALQ